MTTKTETRTTSEWHADKSEPLLETSLGDLLRTVASQVPDRVALVDAARDPAERRSWTYGELLEESERLAHALLTRFEPGERLALWGPNSGRWVHVQQAASLAGLTLVTVNPAYRTEELEYVLRQSRAAGVFFTDEYRGFDQAAAVASLADRLPELRETVSLVRDLEDFVAGSEHVGALPTVSPEAPVQIQYTSGTTGFPKGALLHHRGLVNASRFVANRSGVGDGVVWINAMPMFHIGGGGLTEVGTISNRGTYVLAPEFDPALILELIETYRGDITLAVPTMLHALLGQDDVATRDLSSLRTVMSGASVVPAELVRRTREVFDCDFTIVFGQTEAHGVISQTLLSDSAEDQAETIGRPLPQVDVKIVDPENGEVLPVGESGEICARGYQVMLEYFELPEQTGAAIDEDGWLHFGDLGSMDERGYLRITGRIKDMIIRGGENIFPRELEDLLMGHAEVAQVAVIGIPDEKWGERVGAVVVPADPASPPDPDALRAMCIDKVARYKAPTDWYFVDQLPSTPTGKIRKFLLREHIDSGELDRSARTPGAASPK